MNGKRVGSVTSHLAADRRWWLIAVWLSLQALDVATTAFGLRSGLSEANGLAAGILSSHGELAMYGMKALVTAVVLGSILLLHRRYARLWLALKVVTVYMSLVVAFNLLNIAMEV